MDLHSTTTTLAFKNVSCLDKVTVSLKMISGLDIFYVSKRSFPFLSFFLGLLLLTWTHSHPDPKCFMLYSASFTFSPFPLFFTSSLLMIVSQILLFDTCLIIASRLIGPLSNLLVKNIILSDNSANICSWFAKLMLGKHFSFLISFS